MMQSIFKDTDILTYIKKLDIYTKRYVSGQLAGNWRSKHRGSGFDFEKLRQYQVGDDIRFIDWKSSARTNKLLVRSYQEDRNRAMQVMVDCSASTLFANKRQTMHQIAAMLMLSGMHAQDAVGLGLFTNTLEQYYPAKIGRPHVLQLLHNMLMQQSAQRTTSLNELFRQIAYRKIKNAIVCIISDFDVPLHPGLVNVVAQKNDIIAIRCLAPREQSLPSYGYVHAQDMELGYTRYLALHTASSYELQQWHDQQKSILQQAGVGLLDVEAGKPFIKQLLPFLKHCFV